MCCSGGVPWDFFFKFIFFQLFFLNNLFLKMSSGFTTKGRWGSLVVNVFACHAEEGLGSFPTWVQLLKPIPSVPCHEFAGIVLKES